MTATLGLRVYYEDTDAGGIVYHARHLAFAERARTELLRQLGLTHVELQQTHGLIFVVQRVEVDYQRPARLDDWLVVTTDVARVGGASCVLRQAIARDGAPVAVVTVRLACVRLDDGRPARWPARWGEVLAAARAEKEGLFDLNPVTATNLPAANAANIDLSLWGLFIHAGLVVQLIAVVLILASVWVWAIVFEKLTTLRRVNREAQGFEDRFWSGGSLEGMYASDGHAPRHPMAAVFGSAMAEWQRSAQVAGADIARGSLQDRIERAIGVTITREMDRLERWMTFLATVGSTATFIGLFGTVWGIMSSFQSIAQSNNTSLAVVAPGIAEALFATALGLIAAVPAVMAFNKISTDLARFASRMEAFGSEFSSILSRQIDERA